VVFVTGDQNVSGVKNFSSRPTVNGSGVMLTGETAGTGYLTGFVNKSETGSFVTSGNTGDFVTSSQTGVLTGVFYPYSANPAAYVQGAVVRPSNTGNFVDKGSTQTIFGRKYFDVSDFNRIEISGILNGNDTLPTTGIAFVDPLGGTGLSIQGGGIDLGGIISAPNGTLTLSAAEVLVTGASLVTIHDSSLLVDKFGVFQSGVSGANLVYNTSNQTISGVKNFNSRPQVSGVGLQTTGEYARFNLWDDFSGALYPYPRNDLNRSWNTLKRLESVAGTSGEVIWYNIPQWTGETPVGTGISSFYNTGFWAREYDWSCVAFEGGRTFSGSPTTAAVLISPRHILSTNHSNIQSGTRYAFVSNKETGFTWEAEVQSVARISGDATVLTLSQDAPSQIVPASIIGSLPTSSWGAGSLNNVRALTVKNSTVLFDCLDAISTGVGFQSGSLTLSHFPEVDSRFTGQHEGGDSNSPVFLPLDNGKLALLGVASTASSVAFIGDPAIRSGIISSTSGYSVDIFNPEAQSTSVLPVSGQLFKLGSLINPWSEVYAGTVSGTTITANSFNGATSKLYLGYSSLAFNGNRTVSSGSRNLSFQPRDNSLITLSGTFPVTTLFDFVITGSNVVTFTGIDTTLITPHGSGFSGSGSIVEVRSVGSNVLMVSRQGSNTGYLTGYAPIADSITGISVDGSSTKTITLYQLDGSTLSASFTDQQGTGGAGSDYYIYSGSFDAGNGNLTLNRTGDAGTVVIPLDGRYVTGSVVRPSETGLFVTSGQTGNFITSSQTGAFYPTSNPSGYITGLDLSSYATIASTTGISGHLQTQITNNNQTGAFLTTGAADSRYALQSATGAYTGEFYPRSSNPSNYLVAADIANLASTGYVTGVSGYLQGQITTLNSQTGSYVTGSVIRPSETGNFVTTSQTGQFYAASNPANYITGVDLSSYATTGYVTGVSGYLASLISASSAGVGTLNGLSGSLTIAGAGNNSVSVAGSTITVSGNTGFLTGYQIIGNYVPYNGATGQVDIGAQTLISHAVKADSSDGLQILSNNGSTGIVVGAGGSANVTAYGALKLDYATTNKVPIIDANKNLIASSVTTGEVNSLTGVTSPIQGQFSAINSVTGSFALSSNTGAFLTTGAADNRYSLNTGIKGIYVDAGAMLTGSVSGATPLTLSVSNSGIAHDVYSFDPAVSGFVQFKFKLADYNLGGLRAKFDWTTSGASGGVVWGIQAISASDGDSLNIEWGTAAEVTDTFITGTGFHLTSGSPSFSPSPTPLSGDMLYFRVYRDVSDTNDTLAVNANLLGVSLQYTGTNISTW
jgi:hypothetical protein